jgi:hypothetical protein
VPRGGEAGHVGADLGDDRLRGGAANATDLIQPLDRLSEGAISASILRSSSATSVLAWSTRPSIVASRKA